MRRHQECALVSRDLADCSESLVWPRPGHIYFYSAVSSHGRTHLRQLSPRQEHQYHFLPWWLFSLGGAPINACHLSLVTSHIKLVQLSQEAHESCFSRRPRKGSPVCESHLLHWEGRGQPASGGHCERRWGCCWAERSSLPVNRPAPEPPYQFPISGHNKTKQSGRRQTGQTFPLLNAETFQTHLRRSDEPDVNKSFTNQAILAKILFFFTFFYKRSPLSDENSFYTFWERSFSSTHFQ